jgi:hypothetical protein
VYRRSLGKEASLRMTVATKFNKAPFEDERRVWIVSFGRRPVISPPLELGLHTSLDSSKFRSSETSPIKNLCRGAKVTHQHAVPSCKLALGIANAARVVD